MIYQINRAAYQHTAYSNASDGSVDFSLTENDDAAYIGRYISSSSAESGDPDDYVWVETDDNADAENVEEPDEYIDDNENEFLDIIDLQTTQNSQATVGAQETGDSKNTNYYQADEPNAGGYVFSAGDMWYDTDDGNHAYRWDGSAWVDAQDQTFIDRLFSTDITATGTISGVKLRGQQIDIEARGAESETHIRTIAEADEYILEIGNVYGEESALIGLTPRLVHIGAPVISIYCTDHFEANYITNTYTSFDSDMVSSGTVTVVKRLGQCYVSGEVWITDMVPNWTNILNNEKIPAPQNGVGLYDATVQWTSDYTRPLRIGIGGGGSLCIQYGEAGHYRFVLSPYPFA